MEQRGMTEEAINEKVKITDRVITMEWLNANPNSYIVAEEEATGYCTYGMLNGKAHTFKKITCKEVYPGIDIEYFFNSKSNVGFEYNIILNPGADISQLQLLWGGDARKTLTDKNGALKISSDLGSFNHSYPVSFYTGDPVRKIGSPRCCRKN
jgi:hypothetical protein